MPRFIPVNAPIISRQARTNVAIALKTGWISSAGSFVNQFEQQFAAYLGVKHAITVSNGTAALHVALLACGIGPGDEVIVPAFTMASTWLAVIYTGAKPVFVDCTLDTYNIDPALISSCITSRTRAIIPVHIYGHPVDFAPIKKIAQKHKLKIIEDAAEAHGALYHGKKCGSLGDIACFSFYGNKIITCGEGGMVATNSDELAARARKFKDLCHTEQKRFIHDEIGYNYRITNLQAAVGCGELSNIKAYLNKKSHMSKLYFQGLKKIPGIILPTTHAGVTNVHWMYAIRIEEHKFGLSKDILRIKLKERGIDTRDFFYPPNQQPVLKPYLPVRSNFPITQLISQTGCYLPSGLSLTDNQIRRVVSIIKSLYV